MKIVNYQILALKMVKFYAGIIPVQIHIHYVPQEKPVLLKKFYVLMELAKLQVTVLSQ